MTADATNDANLGRIAVAHQRIEKWMMAFMVIGLFAMFQPWFRSIASWFNGLTDSGDASEVYRVDIAPVVFRYGFFLLLASTLGFIIVGHYTPLMLQKAFNTKGRPLTFWLIFLPLGYGLMVIGNLAYGYALGSLLGVMGAVASIAVWNWRAWGLVLVGAIGVLAIGAFVAGSMTWLGAVVAVLFAAVTVVGVAPRRAQFRSEEPVAA